MSDRKDKYISLLEEFLLDAIRDLEDNAEYGICQSCKLKNTEPCDDEKTYCRRYIWYGKYSASKIMEKYSSDGKKE